MKTRKKIIIARYREKLNLVVDMPRQGSGRSNTGNIAHRAFDNPEAFSNITGIWRFRTIIRAICSGYLQERI